MKKDKKKLLRTIRIYLREETGKLLVGQSSIYKELQSRGYDKGSCMKTLYSFFNEHLNGLKPTTSNKTTFEYKVFDLEGELVSKITCDKKPFAYKDYKTQAKLFYKSADWRKLRYEVLKEQEGRCQLCGRTSKDGVIMHCDHIEPLSKNWSRRLDKSNIQVLCEDCNLGKSNTDSIDWR